MDFAHRVGWKKTGSQRLEQQVESPWDGPGSRGADGLMVTVFVFADRAGGFARWPGLRATRPGGTGARREERWRREATVVSTRRWYYGLRFGDQTGLDWTGLASEGRVLSSFVGARSA